MAIGQEFKERPVDITKCFPEFGAYLLEFARRGRELSTAAHELIVAANEFQGRQPEFRRSFREFWNRLREMLPAILEFMRGPARIHEIFSRVLKMSS